jgi:hypothetical protein
MEKFKPGQKVVVKLLHNLQHDGAARIVKYLNYGDDKGKYMVELPGSGDRLAVTEDRLVDEKDYWREKNEQRNRLQD